MSAGFVPVTWNRNKWLYDAVLLLAMAAFIWIFLRVAPEFQDVSRPVDGAVLRMRAFGTLAFLMLTLILCIGPLARLDKRFLPLLYNRRHFGVLTCAVAAVHAGHVLGWYFAFSPIDPYVALLGSNTAFDRLVGFPFELFGIAAFLILVVMAVTSHDFWLHFLGAPLWKALHMAVYAAYGAVVLHVAFGYLQDVQNPFFAFMVALSVGTVCLLHLLAGRQEQRDLANAADPQPDGDTDWIRVGLPEDIPLDRAVIITPPDGDRIAVFRDAGRVGALSHACAHQNGPLGEGRIVFGCVTCPWHGFQYRLEDGCSPPPFTEKIPTYRMRQDAQRVLWVDPTPAAPGTPQDLINLPPSAATPSDQTVEPLAEEGGK